MSDTAMIVHDSFVPNIGLSMNGDSLAFTPRLSSGSVENYKLEEISAEPSIILTTVFNSFSQTLIYYGGAEISEDQKIELANQDISLHLKKLIRLFHPDQYIGCDPRLPMVASQVSISLNQLNAYLHSIVPSDAVLEDRALAYWKQKADIVTFNPFVQKAFDTLHTDVLRNIITQIWHGALTKDDWAVYLLEVNKCMPQRRNANYLAQWLATNSDSIFRTARLIAMNMIGLPQPVTLEELREVIEQTLLPSTPLKGQVANISSTIESTKKPAKTSEINIATLPVYRAEILRNDPRGILEDLKIRVLDWPTIPHLSFIKSLLNSRLFGNQHGVISRKS
jgi:hypothetical protein